MGEFALSNDVHERAYTEAVKRQVKDEKVFFFLGNEQKRIGTGR